MWQLALPIVGNLLDKIFPDKTKADEAKAKLIELQMNCNRSSANLRSTKKNQRTLTRLSLDGALLLAGAVRLVCSISFSSVQSLRGLGIQCHLSTSRH
jgi:hypothetical protein